MSEELKNRTADECLFWMEIIMEKDLVDASRVKPLYEEGEEILSIVVASIKTARKRKDG